MPLAAHRCFPHHAIVFALLAGAMGIPDPASAQDGEIINEDLKLVATDGSSNDLFGWSVDVDNGVVAVGSFQDNPNGFHSGSAYLFDLSTGAQLFKLVPSDGATGDRFGWSVEISDGVVAIGAPLDDDNGEDSGSVYLFDVSTGAQLTKLLAGDGITGDQFGFSVAMANGVVAIGAPRDNDNGTDSGSAYLFDAITGDQLAKLLPADGAEREHFGDSIAASTTTVAVGSPGDDDNGFQSGSAYTFDLSTAVQTAKIFPDDPVGGSQFGTSIDIDSEAIAVGTVSGVAYLFDTGTNAQFFRLLPFDLGEDPSSGFGASIALDNGTVAVGAVNYTAGAVYVIDTSTGEQLKLIASDGLVDLLGQSVAAANGVVVAGAPASDSAQGAAYLFSVDFVPHDDIKLLAHDGAKDDLFGISASVDNDIVAVGARFDDDNGTDSGSAYLFDAQTGLQLAKLLPQTGAAGDTFGFAIAINNDVVAAGAPFNDTNGSDSGEAYLFDAITGDQIASLLPSDGAPNDRFGWSIAINAGIVAVGSPLDDDPPSNAGSVYIFDADTAVQTAKLLADDGAAFDEFGSSVATAGGFVAVGAPRDDDNGTTSGSAYVFDLSTGTQVAKLLPEDGAADDRFGASVALENGLVVVGAPGDDTNSGSAYVFDLSTGSQIAKLLPGNENGGGFGASIAINAGIVAVGTPEGNFNGSGSGSAFLFDAMTGEQLAMVLPFDDQQDDVFGSAIAAANGTLVVTSPMEDIHGVNSGAAYVFDIGMVINNKILPNDGMEDDRFGFSIAVDNGVIAVGAVSADESGLDSGSAYTFDALGTQLAKLVPNDGAPGDRFATSIDIDNGVVVIGVMRDDDNDIDSGSAYLFDAQTGAQIAKLLSNDGARNDFFGVSAAIDNGIVVIGAQSNDDNGDDSGSAYLFDALTGLQIAKLLPNDGATSQEFGISVAIDSGVVAVGAWLDNDNGPLSGAAYLFDAASGAQLAKLLPDDGQANDRFGTTIAIANGIVVVGADRDDDNGTDSGSAYLFDATTGTQIAKLLPDDAATGDHFGRSVAFANGIVAIGANQDDDNGISSGSAYLFSVSTGAQIAKLLPFDGAEFDNFGWSIAIDSSIVAVGAPFDDDNGEASGSAYVFTVPAVGCPADLDGDNDADSDDFFSYLDAFAVDDLPVCDLDGDLDCDSDDFFAYLDLFAAGC